MRWSVERTAIAMIVSVGFWHAPVGKPAASMTNRFLTSWDCWNWFSTDVFGIPVLHFDIAWGENEKAMIRDMAVTAAEMLESAGGKNVQPFALENRIPGYSIHEMGTARMGSDPKQSVLNQFQQSHDIKNLFVMDAAGFTSGACQNPTLTIMALAVRSTDHLMDELKKGNL